MKSKKKQTVSLLLLLVVIVGLFPVSAAAEDNTGLCEHHPAHIGCTYAEAVLGADCRHVHDEFCGYGDECECTHTHDEACGYVEAADAVVCNFVCESCSPPEANGENTEKNKGVVLLHHPREYRALINKYPTNRPIYHDGGPRAAPRGYRWWCHHRY